MLTGKNDKRFIVSCRFTYAGVYVRKTPTLKQREYQVV